MAHLMSFFSVSIAIRERPGAVIRHLPERNLRMTETGQYFHLKYYPAAMHCLIWSNAMKHMFSPRHPDIIRAEIAADAERSSFL